MKGILDRWGRRLGIPPAGVCGLEHCLPLTNCRALARVPRAARSVIVAAFPYDTGPRREANVSRYAMVADYHQVAGDLLWELTDELTAAFPGEEFVPFVDNSPIREVAAARAAGIGVVGRNGLIITRKYGSLVFLGTVVTTLPPAGFPTAEADAGCENCGRCVRACPTGALSPAGFRWELCRSHITQKKGGLTPWEEAQIRDGGLVWGCDLCQTCCPRNRGIPPTPIPAFQSGVEPVFHPRRMDSLMKRMAYGYRGAGVLRRNWSLVTGEEYPL